MKKSVLSLFFTFMTVCLNVVSNSPHTDGQKAINPKKVYYVVVCSCSTLEEAQKYNYNCPDGLECWIYKAYAKGKTVYRVCYSCHSTKAKAMAQIKYLKESPYAVWFTDAWIWPSNGLGKCVECPVSYETGKPQPPLSAK